MLLSSQHKLSAVRATFPGSRAGRDLSVTYTEKRAACQRILFRMALREKNRG